MMRLPVGTAVHLCLGLNTDDLLRDKSSTLLSQVHKVLKLEYSLLFPAQLCIKHKVKVFITPGWAMSFLNIA